MTEKKPESKILIGSGSKPETQKPVVNKTTNVSKIVKPRSTGCPSCGRGR